MNKALLVGGTQRAGHLKHDFQCQRGRNRPVALHHRLDGFSVHKFHRVKIFSSFVAKVEDGRHIRVAQCGRGTRFTQKPLARNLAAQVGGIDNLQRDKTPEICIKRLIRNPHRAPPQLVKRSILTNRNFKMLEADGFGHGKSDLT